MDNKSTKAKTKDDKKDKTIDFDKTINDKELHLDDGIFDKIEEKTLKIATKDLVNDDEEDKKEKKKKTKSKKKKTEGKRKKEEVVSEEVNLEEDSNLEEEKENIEVEEKEEIEEKKEIEDKELISDEFVEKKKVKRPKRILINFFLIIVLLVGLASFIVNLYFIKNSTNLLYTIITSLLLVLFAIIFIPISNSSKNKGAICFGSLCLIGYFVFNIITNLGVVDINKFNTMEDFTGKNLTEVVKWAEENKITINQDYEYSDMVQEYKIISQNVKAGTSLKDCDELTVAVSEGPNPSKEVVVPNMLTWDAERVVEFVTSNYLSNVKVEFVESDKNVDTVIEQDKSGNLKRDEEINLVFSYGEELGYEEVKLIDFTKKSKFEVEFYLKQHHLNYKFERDFSDKIKHDLAFKQNKKPGTMVKINDEEVVITFSKGPKIKVPDLTKMNLSEIVEWVIKNKLKVEFSDKYDDSIKENEVISASHKKGDVVEQGETIKVVISKGSLKMPKFKSFDEFREWADKYEIKYEEKHEFSSEVKAGEVISYSYKTGDTIKNDDVIIVTISDGEAVKVPNLKGLTKSEVIKKLEKLGLKYSFVSRYSDTVSEGKVINQSISAGSEISENTTISVTISKGKAPEEKKTNSNSSTNNRVEENNTPACDESIKTTVYIYDELLDFNDPKGTCSKIKQAYGNVKFACSYVKNAGLRNGMLQNSSEIDGVAFDHCNTVTLKIVSND